MGNRGVESRITRAAPASCAAGVARGSTGGVRVARLAPLLLCSALAGCSTGSEMLVFSDPGKYQYHSCEQLATTAKGVAVRREELAKLIERAEQGMAGVVVSTIAYKSEYTAIGQDLRLLESVARDKSCVIAPTWRSNTAIQ
jgi:hypothetical protein